MLTFANYANTINNAIKQTDEEIVNLLLACIYKPNGTQMKSGESFYIDKATASHYLNATRPLHRDILVDSKTEKVISGAVAYFEESVIPEVNSALETDMLEQLKRLISFDASISFPKKTELLEVAKKETLAVFLASVLLYVVNKPNIIYTTITEHNNLPPQNRYFTGRVDYLDRINGLFKKQTNNAINICQTLKGLGGIGKTQLAIEYAYRYCGDFENCIWFINAETSNTTHNTFVLFAEHFKLPLQSEYTPEDLQSAVKKWLTDNKNWLLIYDNLESAATIQPYLPEKIRGRLIITTRNTRIDLGKQIELGVFEMDEAKLFVKKRLSNSEELPYDELGLEFYNKNDKDFENEVSTLIIRLGFLPLALEQAAAYIKQAKCTITKYLLMLTQSGLETFEERQAVPENYIKTNDFEKIVTATWNISFQALNYDGSRQLLNLCAYMAPDRIPIAFFAEMREKLPSPIKEDLAKEITKNRIVGDLQIYSLVNGDADYINIHRLVQEVVRKSHGY